VHVTPQNFSNTYRFVADEITDKEFHRFTPQNDVVSTKPISQIIVRLSYFPEFDQNKFCGRICAYILDRKGLKRFPLVIETPDSGKPSAQFQANHRARSPFKSFQLLPGPRYSLLRRHFQ